MSTGTTLLPVIWTILHSFLHGFHLSSLNGIEDALTCSDPGDLAGKFGLTGCLPLSDTQFGLATTIFTIGGLVGSLGADIVTQRFGRVGTLRLAEMGFILGSVMVGSANVLSVMIIGRIVIGLASGLIMVSVPLCLAEIAPKRYLKLYGTLHQISIGTGMIAAQSLSLRFARVFEWRYVLVTALGVGLVLLVGSLGMGQGVGKVDEDEERPLLQASDDPDEKPLSVREVLSSSDQVVKRGLLVVVVAMVSAQAVGISPVMYFSTHILTPVFHANSKVIVLGIMAIGIPFNFVPGLLPSSFGSKRLLMLSAAGTTLSSALLIFGLNRHHQALSGIGIIAFVLSFSIGLAPMPWLVLSEVMPSHARTAGGSIGVCLNWLTNFTAGSSFLPLQKILKNGDTGEGNVFYVFTATGALAFMAIWSSYRLYERVRE